MNQKTGNQKPGCLNDAQPIGGPGTVVQLDEAYMHGRRKNHVGRLPDHTVLPSTLHKWTQRVPPTPARQAVTRLNYPEGWKAELAYSCRWLGTYQDGLTVTRQSPIQVVTVPSVKQLRWPRPTCCHYTTQSPMGQDNYLGGWALFRCCFR